MMEPRELDKDAQIMKLQAQLLEQNWLLEARKGNRTFQKVKDVLPKLSLTEREEELAVSFVKYKKDNSGVAQRAKKSKDSLLKPCEHYFCCMKEIWQPKYRCPDEEQLEELSSLSLGIRNVKYYRDWSSAELCSEIENVFKGLAICGGYFLCMKMGKFLKHVMSNVPDGKSLKGIFPKMVYIIPMQNSIIGTPDPNFKIPTVTCRDCNREVARSRMLTHRENQCFEEMPLAGVNKYECSSSSAFSPAVVSEQSSSPPTSSLCNDQSHSPTQITRPNSYRPSRSPSTSVELFHEARSPSRNDSSRSPTRTRRQDSYHSSRSPSKSIESYYEKRRLLSRSPSRNDSNRSSTRMRRHNSYRSSRSPAKSIKSYHEKRRLLSRSPSRNDSSPSPTRIRRQDSYRSSRSPSKSIESYYGKRRLLSRSPSRNDSNRSPTPMRSHISYRSSRSPSKSIESYHKKRRLLSRSPSRNDSSPSQTRMRRQDSYRSSRSPCKSMESYYKKRLLLSRSPSRNDYSRSPSRIRRQNSYRSRQLPSTSSSRHDLSPSQAERKSPSGSDRKRSALSKSKSPSLVTTAARTNVLTLENVMEIKFPSVNEMERYIQENNAQIVSRNDCLNMQPTETPHHSEQPVETPHHSAQPVETPQHSAYCAELPAMLSSSLGKNDAPLSCGDNIFEKVNGKYPSGDEVSEKLNQYLEESKKELEDLFAEPEEEVMDCEKLEFVLGIVMQRIKSLQCLLYLENFGKTCNFDHSIHRDLFDTMIGIFCNCKNLHKDYYGQTVDFVKSKLDVIFTGEKVTRKYIYDVLVPECFTFAVMEILCVSNAVASNIRQIGFSVQQVNQLCAKFKRD